MVRYITKQQAAKGASSPHAGKIHSLLASFTTEEALLKTRSAAIAQGFYSFRVYLSCIFEHTLKDFENVPHLQPHCHPGGDTCHTSRHPATQEGTCATPPTTLPPSRGHVPHLLQPRCHPAGDKFHQTFSSTYNCKHQTLGPFHPTMCRLQ